MIIIKIITKIKKGKWRARHYDYDLSPAENGFETYHKTLKDAKAYEHTQLTFDPFPMESNHE